MRIVQHAQVDLGTNQARASGLSKALQDPHQVGTGVIAGLFRTARTPKQVSLILLEPQDRQASLSGRTRGQWNFGARRRTRRAEHVVSIVLTVFPRSILEYRINDD